MARSTPLTRTPYRTLRSPPPTPRTGTPCRTAHQLKITTCIPEVPRSITTKVTRFHAHLNEDQMCIAAVSTTWRNTSITDADIRRVRVLPPVRPSLCTSQAQQGQQTHLVQKTTAPTPAHTILTTFPRDRLQGYHTTNRLRSSRGPPIVHQRMNQLR
jgi:hypothetical protein